MFAGTGPGPKCSSQEHLAWWQDVEAVRATTSVLSDAGRRAGDDGLDSFIDLIPSGGKGLQVTGLQIEAATGRDSAS